MSPYTLIAPDEPAVPVVLDSPHSGTDYPENFGYCVATALLRQSEDTWVDALYADAPRYGATLLCARFPRAYIDPNRALADLDPQLLADAWPESLTPTAKTELGMGLIWRVLNTGDAIYARKLTSGEVQQRIDRCYRPYHEALSRILERAHARFGRFWHLNCHSMPAVAGKISIEGQGVLRPDFVLGDRDGTSCEPEFTAFVHATLQDMGYDVRVNYPYKGVELVRAYSDPRRQRHSLQIEVNRRLYMNEATLERNDGYALLKIHIERLLAAIREYANHHP